ncbi:hypothetical protein [Vibrio phage VP4B]|uniref:Uncharacterized protein n=1 Tax=Vibrio phage VP4B TaxID=1262540 RepID=V9M0I2_9CAUD|nr:hypothetical protein FDJ61_gp034 [Vibrio phage VP4B]AGB07148.1 hypothetical protein [Vibrio phage VP4B]
MQFQKQRSLNGSTDFLKLRGFDSDMLPVVRAVNRCKELATHQCCSGHPERDPTYRTYHIQMMYTEKALKTLHLIFTALSGEYPHPNMVRLSFVRKRVSLQDRRETSVAVISVDRSLGVRPSALSINQTIIHALTHGAEE